VSKSTAPISTPFHFDFRRAPAASMLFLLGVALVFAPLLLLTVTPLRPIGAATTATWFAISGGCAILWALGGTASRWFFLVAIPAQMLAGLAIGGGWLGPVSLGEVRANPVGTISVLCIAAGYTCFVSYIVVHGRRAMALSVEMSLAARIHKHLVPPIDLATGSFLVSARSNASGVMGGDVLHAEAMPDGSILALVADVSGHGVRAGVVMAMVRAAIESHRARDGSESGRELIAALAHELNRVLVRLTEPDMFVTAAIVHVAMDGEYHALVAAHPPILHRRALIAGAPRTLIQVGGAGLPLGVIDELDAAASTGRLDPGDELVLYSDGLTEARVRAFDGRALGGAPSLLGVEGLERSVATMPSEPREAVACVLDAVTRAAVSTSAEDDQTILILQRTPHGGSE